MKSRASSLSGFTLIELLVVIAIIGILSSVVLGSLALARLKGADANIKANLHTVQLQMEYTYDATNSYGATGVACPLVASATAPNAGAFADSTTRNAIQAALNQGGPGIWAIDATRSSYVVAVPLKAASGQWWCLDASGKATQEPAANMTCGNISSGSGYACP